MSCSLTYIITEFYLTVGDEIEVLERGEHLYIKQ